ncbi:MAG: glycosyltransferase [Chitinophagales bacterium]
MYEKFISAGIPIILKSTGYFNLRKWYFVLRYFKSENISGIVAFHGNFGGVLMVLAWIAGVEKRIVFYRRSTPAFELTFLKRLYHYLSGRLILLFATHILSNSKSAFTNFFPGRENRDKRFKIIRNGVESKLLISSKNKSALRFENDIPNDAIIIGHVGRYDPAKNHETIFAVAKVVCQLQPNIYFLFCGLGTDSTAFKERLDYYGITKYCYCLGVSDIIGDVYCMMDIFFFPSITEGQPNALIEAMIAGLPIIASNIDAIKEATPHSFYDKLIDPFAIDSFITIFKEILNNQIEIEGYMHSDFSKDQFDVEKRFFEFQKVLND